MNRDDIIRMAREAGVGRWDAQEVAIERFAALVAAAQREACAKDAEWCIQNHLEHLMPERIRARGQA